MTIIPQLGSEYLYLHHGSIITVRVERQYSTLISNKTNRWVLLNLATKRNIVAKSKRKFLSKVN